MFEKLFRAVKDRLDLRKDVREELDLLRDALKRELHDDLSQTVDASRGKTTTELARVETGLRADVLAELQRVGDAVRQEVRDGLARVETEVRTDVLAELNRIGAATRQETQAGLARVESGLCAALSAELTRAEADMRHDVSAAAERTSAGLQEEVRALRKAIAAVKGDLSGYALIACSKFFERDWYAQTYLQDAAGVDPIRHYLETGWREGNAPGRAFDGEAYLAANPDVRKAGLNPLLHYLQFGQKEGRRTAPADSGVPFSLQAADTPAVAFSVIMPTFNRAGLIVTAIDSLLAQTYRRFELIVVDDGSTDGTETVLRSRYADELANGVIRYFKQTNGGVCSARNLGLRQARNAWIAYLDSDNRLYPHFLQTFADAISTSRGETFYAAWTTMSGARTACRPSFDYAQLMKANFIDLGVFVHSRRLYEELGGFDERLTRLVDWELILRYTKRHPPQAIEKSVLLYNDGRDYARITTTCDLEANRAAILERHRPKVSVVVPVYNTPPEDIRRTLACLLGQTLHSLEFIFVDDCGVSGAMDVVFDFARKDGRIRIIKNERNAGSGVARNNGLAVATGEYVSFFDADDICDPDFYEKLHATATTGGYEIVKAVRRTRALDGTVTTTAMNAHLQSLLDRGLPLFLGFTAEHTTAVYRTDFLRRHHVQYGTTYASQDTTFLLQASFHCRKIAFIDTCAYTYLKHSYSQTNRFTEPYYLAQIEHLHEKLAFLNAVQPEERHYHRYLAIMLNRSMKIYRESLEPGDLPAAFKQEYLRRLRDVLPSVKGAKALLPQLSPDLQNLLATE